MRVPEHLQHKPIIGVDNYDRIDGARANNSDAKALSIGKSQWDDDEIAAKVWRHTTGDDTGKWSRQSEEIPLNRVIDLAILITSLYLPHNGFSATSLHEVVINPADMAKIKDFLDANESHLKPKLRELKNLLGQINLA